MFKNGAHRSVWRSLVGGVIVLLALSSSAPAVAPQLEIRSHILVRVTPLSGGAFDHVYRAKIKNTGASDYQRVKGQTFPSFV